MTGFFSAAMVESAPNYKSQVPKCGACGLMDGCKTPKMPIHSKGERKILLLGDAPGENEDYRGFPFSGSAGVVLKDVLKGFDGRLSRDCWVTNSLICHPPKGRSPTEKEIDYCRPNLIKAINKFKPNVIIPLGKEAVRSVIAPYWKEDTGPISQWIGWQIPLQPLNAWVCPTYHPSFIEKTKDDKNGPVVKLLFERHLKEAFLHTEQPWDVVPDYQSEIDVLVDPEIAARRIRQYIKDGGPCSWDLETNMLKPDSDLARIRCCSVCWRGKETISFPWVSQTAQAMYEFGTGNNPKIGFNTKFEERWFRRFFKARVKNWVWCGMLSAHHLDNRKGIKSCKFQTLVRLGFPDWSRGIKPYFEDCDENGVNRIEEVDLWTLLLYCGLDSLVEYKVAEHQKKEMKA